MCKGYEFDVLIVPRYNYSSQKVLDMIMEFAEQGGKIAFVESLPFSAADTGKKYDFSFLFNKTVPTKGNYNFIHNEKSAFFHLGPVETFNLTQFSADIKRFIGEQELPFCTNRIPEEITAEQRTGDDFDLCFLMNTGDKETAVVIGLPETGTAEILSKVDEVMPLITFIEEGKSFARCIISPSELVAVAIYKDGVVRKETVKPVSVSGESRKLILEDGWSFEPVGGNILPLRVKFLERNPCVNDILFEKAKFPNPQYACFEIPIETETKYGDHWSACAVFEVKNIPESLTIIAEMDHVEKVYLNSKPLENLVHTRLWGTNDYMTDALPYINKGLNSVLIIGKLPDWAMYHQLNSVVLRGDFKVQIGSVNQSIQL